MVDDEGLRIITSPKTLILIRNWWDRDSPEYIKLFANAAISQSSTPIEHSVSVTLSKSGSHQLRSDTLYPLLCPNLPIAKFGLPKFGVPKFCEYRKNLKEKSLK